MTLFRIQQTGLAILLLLLLVFQPCNFSFAEGKHFLQRIFFWPSPSASVVALFPNRNAKRQTKKEKNKIDDETEQKEMNDDDDEDTPVLDTLQLHPLLQIPCGISLESSSTTQKDDSDDTVPDSDNISIRPISTFLDTGAQRTVMTWDAAERLGFVLPHLDRRYAGQAAGVGKCAVLGRIPAGVLQFQLHDGTTVPAPAVIVLEGAGTAGVEVLLGLDFLREYEAIVDIRNGELHLLIDDEEVSIPFIQPRSSIVDWDEAEGEGDDNMEDGSLSCASTGYLTNKKTLDMSGM